MCVKFLISVNYISFIGIYLTLTWQCYKKIVCEHDKWLRFKAKCILICNFFTFITLLTQSTVSIILVLLGRTFLWSECERYLLTYMYFFKSEICINIQCIFKFIRSFILSILNHCYKFPMFFLISIQFNFFLL